MLELDPPVEPHEGVGPGLDLLLGQPLEVEIVAVDGTAPRPGHGVVGRALAQHDHGELFFLRAVEADGHVVLRAALRQKHLEGVVERAFGQEKVVREEALIGRGVSEVRVLGEEVVEERRAASPMADDEDRRLVERQALRLLLVERFRDPSERGVPRHPDEERQRVGDAVQREREAAAPEEPHQRHETHAEPDIEQAAAVALDGERRHFRLLSASARRLAVFLRRQDLVIGHAGALQSGWMSGPA